MTRVLFHAVHHPHPDHLEDLLGAMRRLNELAVGIDGLEEIGAFHDADGGRVVAVSVWSSPEALQAGSAVLFAGVADLPLDRWESRPRELMTLPEVAR
ncbi:hypothetical protein [Geodermatophilus sp. URMC 62]|uniref:hypothetical protein n=1 Tax=Geodermatophilus sp. URMC 62 TaxID=3423414 RepID=UPI00406BFC9F